MSADAELVNQVRLAVLEAAIDTGAVPDAAEVSRKLARPVAGVIEAFMHLGESHVYVLEPGREDRLRMANPFSAVPTAFRVEARGLVYHGNCVWDALGIVSLLGGSGSVHTACPDCREPMALEVADRRLRPLEGTVHFAVPARRWWDDIIHA